MPMSMRFDLLAGAATHSATLRFLYLRRPAQASDRAHLHRTRPATPDPFQIPLYADATVPTPYTLYTLTFSAVAPALDTI